MSGSQVPASVIGDSLLLFRAGSWKPCQEHRQGFDMSGGDVGNVVASLPVSGLAGDLEMLTGGCAFQNGPER